MKSYGLWIDGNWRKSSSMEWFAVENPANGEKIAEVSSANAEDVELAVSAAYRAFLQWRKLTARVRADFLRRWYELIIEAGNELAALITKEQGKPFQEAQAEIKYAASFLQWFSEEAPRVYGQVIPSPWDDEKIYTLKEPVGVALLITPWNFPAAMITRKAGAALAAGCAVIIKPASDTPLTALRLAELASVAGIPAGVVNVVTGDAEKITKICMDDERIRKVSFTGSTAIGKKLMQQAAKTMKRLSLELGGNAPFIVCEDANIDAALEGLMRSKFRNAGQTCIAANRVLLHEKIQQQFVEKLLAKISALKIGNGEDGNTDIGPLINAKAVMRVAGGIESAINLGAKCIIGGERNSAGANFFTPTILLDMPIEANFWQEEIFAPIVAIKSFSSDEEALILANNQAYGLASYCYTVTNSRMESYIKNLDFGMVAMNSGVLSTSVAPFGGRKESGFGREGGSEGIAEYLDVKMIHLGVV